MKTVECKAHQSTIVIVNLRRSFINPNPEVSMHYPRMHGNHYNKINKEQGWQRDRMPSSVLQRYWRCDSGSDSEEEQDCEEMFFPGSDEEFAYVEEDNE